MNLSTKFVPVEESFLSAQWQQLFLLKIFFLDFLIVARVFKKHTKKSLLTMRLNFLLVLNVPENEEKLWLRGKILFSG